MIKSDWRVQSTSNPSLSKMHVLSNQKHIHCPLFSFTFQSTIHPSLQLYLTLFTSNQLHYTVLAATFQSSSRLIFTSTGWPNRLNSYKNKASTHRKKKKSEVFGILAPNPSLSKCWDWRKAAIMALFSSSWGWNVLALTLLSALIHPQYKAASMPQCLSCKPTLWQLQSTVPPSLCSLFFPPKRGFARASDKGWAGDEMKETAGQPLSRNRNSFWKLHSCTEENYTGNVYETKLFCFVLWLLCFTLSRCNNIVHKASCWHQSSLPITLKPEITFKYLSRASKSVSPEGLAGPCPQTIPGRPACVCVCVGGGRTVAPPLGQACV